MKRVGYARDRRHDNVKNIEGRARSVELLQLNTGGWLATVIGRNGRRAENDSMQAEGSTRERALIALCENLWGRLSEHRRRQR